MANVNKPNGARVITSMNGAGFAGQLARYECDASAANIFPGDVIKMEADGYVAPISSVSDGNLVGVCVGVLNYKPTKTSGKNDHFLSNGSTPDLYKKYHATGSAGVILVYVDPNGLYEMQEDADSSALSLADIGANVNIATTAGDTATGTSRMEIDSSSVTTSSAQFRLVDFVNRPDNELGSVGARWVVRINKSHWLSTSGV